MGGIVEFAGGLIPTFLIILASSWIIKKFSRNQHVTLLLASSITFFAIWALRTFGYDAPSWQSEILTSLLLVFVAGLLLFFRNRGRAGI
jgi:chromate transport protein ChrA